jgi:hypothetical protein
MAVRLSIVMQNILAALSNKCLMVIDTARAAIRTQHDANG